MSVARCVQTELLEDLGRVGFDGSFSDEQFCGDSAVGSAFCQLGEYFALAADGLRKRFKKLGARWVASR